MNKLYVTWVLIVVAILVGFGALEYVFDVVVELRFIDAAFLSYVILWTDHVTKEKM